MASEPQSPFKWTWARSESCIRVWRLTRRETHQIVGSTPHVQLPDGTSAFEGVVWSGFEWVSLGYFDHWVAAKKAVLSAATGVWLHQAVRGESKVGVGDGQ